MVDSAAASSPNTSGNPAEEKQSNVAEVKATDSYDVTESALIKEDEIAVEEVCPGVLAASDRQTESYQGRGESGGDGEQDEEDEDDEDKVTFTLERPQSEHEDETHGDANGAEEMAFQQDHGQMMAEQQQGFGSYGQNQNGFGSNMTFGMNGPYAPMMNMGMGMPGFGSMGNMMGMYFPFRFPFVLLGTLRS